MKFWTWLQIKQKVERDLDLEEETFISESELLAYANEAIDEAEAEVHAIYEDYFLKKATIAVASGTEEYALPSDIYANKIRRIVYKNGATIYPVRRIKDGKKFETYTELKEFGVGNLYSYILVNNTAGSPRILLTPTPQESGNFIEIWYLRNANELTVDADVCDIPEFINFVFQYMKVRCYEKEGHPNLPKAISDLEQQRQLMTTTLTAMVPDADNEIEPDLSWYNELR